MFEELVGSEVRLVNRADTLKDVVVMLTLKNDYEKYDQIIIAKNWLVVSHHAYPLMLIPIR